MVNSLLEQLQGFTDRLQSFEQSLFRKDIVLPFLLGRLLLIVAMVCCCFLAFAVLN